MKFFLIILSTIFFLVSCSGATDVVEPEPSSPETAEDAETINSEDAEIEAGGEENGGEGDENDENSDTEGVNQKNVKLVVKNQATFGQIVVETVATSRDGWVSVHKSQQGGGIQLPESIGEARVSSGDSEDIIVDLWESPEIGEKLWVVLHIDAGERGTYEFPGEDAVVKKDGETMARSFVVKGPSSDEDDDDE